MSPEFLVLWCGGFAFVLVRLVQSFRSWKKSTK